MTKESEQKYIQSYRDYFHSLSPISDETWSFYRPFIETEYLEKGSFFTKVGSPGNKYAYVAKGLFKQYFTTKEGKEYITSFIEPNRMVSDYVALIQNNPSRTDIVAIEDSILLTIKTQGARKQMELNPTLEAIGRCLAEIRYIEKENKEWDFLHLDAKDRYLKFCSERADILGRLSQIEIASYLGISNVSLSRISNNLKKS